MLDSLSVGLKLMLSFWLLFRLLSKIQDSNSKSCSLVFANEHLRGSASLGPRPSHKEYVRGQETKSLTPMKVSEPQ